MRYQSSCLDKQKGKSKKAKGNETTSFPLLIYLKTFPQVLGYVEDMKLKKIL
jgi:hypothetical protein